MKIPFRDFWTDPIHVQIARGRIARGEYDRPCVVDCVVDGLLDDMDDSDDQTRMNEDAHGWIE